MHHAHLTYRKAVPEDAAACVRLRGQTRQNAVSAERLRSLGITAESWAEDVRSDALPGYICTDGDTLVGYCFGEKRSGEVVVLALLPTYENCGIGRCLLSSVVADFAQSGIRRLFLGCSSDPASRSYGFYRHLGWKSTGIFEVRGDEVLEYFVS